MKKAEEMTELRSPILQNGDPPHPDPLPPGEREHLYNWSVVDGNLSIL